MQVKKLEEMTGGWFIGDFQPTLYKTTDVEVAVKHYKAGQSEASHHHKIATEFTVVVHGEVEINGQRFTTGDVVVIQPGESAAFKSVTDAITTVVKIPGAPNDKYID